MLRTAPEPSRQVLLLILIFLVSWRAARQPVNRRHSVQLCTTPSDIFVRRSGALEEFSGNPILKPVNDLNHLCRQIASTRIIVFQKGRIL